MMKISRNPYLLPFILVTSLFFLWAFVHNLEPILIPHLKKACRLTDFESALIDSAVYIGYFLMALPAGMLIKRYGYKYTIVAGLLVYAVGAFLFLPAASTRIYIYFLGALFIIASGCAFLETAANPFVTILGEKQSATQRLNFSQSFNGLGAFLAPLLGGQLILSGIVYSEAELEQMPDPVLDAYLQQEADAVKTPYLVIGSVVLLVAVAFLFTKMPDQQHASSAKRFSLFGALKYSHLRFGVIAQFFYVGAQVCITSFFIRYAFFTGAIAERSAALWLGGAMFGFMIGRFLGTYLLKFVSSQKLLMIYSAITLVLLLFCTFIDSRWAIIALAIVPFFESIMFPTIFALAIQDLGEDTEAGSALLVMSIAGGAFLPLLMGYLSDRYNIQIAYIIPLLCIAIVYMYAFSFERLKIKIL